MRKILIAAALLCVANVAQAETWKVRNQNIRDAGPSSCAEYQDGYLYTLVAEHGILTMSGPNGRSFSVEIGALGAVKHEFRSPNGGRFVVSGNALTRDLTVQNVNSHCASRLVPMS